MTVGVRPGTNGSGSVGMVLFDLDGTLVDSAPDIARSVNILMKDNGLSPHSLPAVRSMIGHGIMRLVERAFAAHGIVLSEDALTRQYDAMMEIYATNLVGETRLRRGAGEAVTECANRKLVLGCVTNKPEGFSRAILAHFGLLDMMATVIGGDSGFARKPAPDMLLAAARHSTFEPGEILLVGDSAADRDAARAAGMRCVLIEDGYCDRKLSDLAPDAIIAGFAELFSVMATLDQS
ncbi:HAD-IA family hydrolase [Pararhizobium haloflavum]|uniref:HAD-IA family hydrolase n=1 Tax=Pararhizobium haloflavum TaxID=2037914 RepID=UPI000C199D93|nr:HAD-IA family hydrolase [Pararhizobium haloflavum]